MDKKASLDSLIQLRLGIANIAFLIEEMEKKTNCRLIGHREPNPALAYAQEITKLIIDACKKYKPEEVEEALRKQAPYLFE